MTLLSSESESWLSSFFLLPPNPTWTHRNVVHAVDATSSLTRVPSLTSYFPLFLGTTFSFLRNLISRPSVGEFSKRHTPLIIHTIRLRRERRLFVVNLTREIQIRKRKKEIQVVYVNDRNNYHGGWYQIMAFSYHQRTYRCLTVALVGRCLVPRSRICPHVLHQESLKQSVIPYWAISDVRTASSNDRQ